MRGLRAVRHYLKLANRGEAIRLRRPVGRIFQGFTAGSRVRSVISGFAAREQGLPAKY